MILNSAAVPSGRKGKCSPVTSYGIGHGVIRIMGRTRSDGIGPGIYVRSERVFDIGIKRFVPGFIVSHGFYLPGGRHFDIFPVADRVGGLVKVNRTVCGIRYPMKFPCSIQRQVVRRFFHAFCPGVQLGGMGDGNGPGFFPVDRRGV